MVNFRTRKTRGNNLPARLAAGKKPGNVFSNPMPVHPDNSWRLRLIYLGAQ
jgi:hypothetical protein